MTPYGVTSPDTITWASLGLYGHPDNALGWFEFIVAKWRYRRHRSILVNIGSGNGLMTDGMHQAITWTNISLSPVRSMDILNSISAEGNFTRNTSVICHSSQSDELIFIHYRKKVWNIQKAQWKHLCLTFWFAGNSLAPITNQYWDLMQHSLAVLWTKNAICNVRN